MAEVAPAEVGHGDTHDDHHEESFWSKYVFSTDHKIIGFSTCLLEWRWLSLGFFAYVFRMQPAFPGSSIPFWGTLSQPPTIHW